VEGPILAKWETLTDEQKKDLGAPYDNQKNTADNMKKMPAFQDEAKKHGLPDRTLIRNNISELFVTRK